MNRRIMHWPKIVILFAAVGTLLLTALSVRYVIWGFGQAAKYRGDVDNALTNDLVTFSMTENAGTGKGSYLSQWHNGRRVFDTWSEHDVDEQTIKFEYWYLNPFQRFSEHIDIYVDKRRHRPWPFNANDHTPRPVHDYPILRIETSLNKP